MKRIGNLYQRICEIRNLELADDLAARGKMKKYAVIKHRANQDLNLLNLQNMLLDKTYQTSKYEVFTIYEPKEREIYRLPYFPDRIVHHAVMNVLEPIFVSTFTADTYSCIKKRGIHKALRSVRESLRDIENTQYCLKMDITKFYPSVDHDILKVLLRHKFKDQDVLWLLDEIIDSAPGLPIGNYLSQYLANFYLTYFDHWIKEKKGVQYYFRYADDMVILSRDKKNLHQLMREIREYLQTNLKLYIKGNYQIFPVASRGIDFVGYRLYHTHVLLRKSIKKRFAKAVRNEKSAASIASYRGWAKHADCRNLERKLLINEKV